MAEYTLSQIGDYLTTGFWVDQGYSGSQSWAGNTISYNLSGLASVGAQNLVRQAFDVWADVANLTFTETSGSANITIDDTYSGAFSSSSLSGSTIVSSYINVSSAWTNYYGTGTYSYSFQTFIHEIGHSLGLGHAGPYNGSATYGVDNIYDNDTWSYSVMSYFDQVESGYGSYALVMTPQLGDITGIQSLYGAATTRSGDTTYGFNTNAGSLYDFSTYTNTPAMTIYDSGGTDTLDFSGFSTNQAVNLTAGSFSSVGTDTNNIAISTGVIIENAIGGSGNDTITGNSASNVLTGNAGDDHMYGLDGNDTFYGGSGTDWVHFISNLASYTISIFSSSIQIINNFVDTIWDDVERFVFSDQTLSYLQMLGLGVDVEIEANGDYTLLKTGTSNYVLQHADGSRVAISSGGVAAGPSTFTGWQMIHGEESQGGGYEVLWSHDSGIYSWWQTDASGEFKQSRVLGSSDLIDYETVFEADLNQDGTIGNVAIQIDDIDDFNLVNDDEFYGQTGAGSSGMTNQDQFLIDTDWGGVIVEFDDEVDILNINGMEASDFLNLVIAQSDSDTIVSYDSDQVTLTNFAAANLDAGDFWF